MTFLSPERRLFFIKGVFLGGRGGVHVHVNVQIHVYFKSVEVNVSSV